MTVESRGRDVIVGARSIRVHEFGQGPALLLLHGGGAGANGLSNYGRNIEALARRFRVIVADMPGYGASTKGLDQGDVFGDLAATMLGLLDALGIAQAHIVGNSLGGACALRMALDAPERIGRLVLMGPGGIGTTRGLPTEGIKKLIGYYKGDGPSREKLIEFIRNYLVFDGAEVPDDLIEQRYQASIDPEVVAAPPLQGPSSFDAAFRMDLTRDKRLKALPHHTLVLWGREDRVNKPSGGRTLARTLKNCDLYEFANTGHWVQWERAEEFNAVTLSFLSQAAA
ncbi:MAG: alpha/beta fold hydrolase [Proteobacteria bacterium]|nr:alpha/beta fold hydrolase [Pseudomonadota bacterium]